jgi:hypothetical protein
MMALRNLFCAISGHCNGSMESEVLVDGSTTSVDPGFYGA